MPKRLPWWVVVNLYIRKVLHLREGVKPISELSICVHGSELKTDGFNAEGPAVSLVD